MYHYQKNIGDYRSATMHFSLLEHGIYNQLLDWYYLDEAPIPSDNQVVFRRLSARTEEEQKAVVLVLSEMFKLTDAGYIQSRVEREVTAYKTRLSAASANGKLGGRPNKTKQVISNNPTETKQKPNPLLTVNRKPITVNRKPTKEKELTPLARLVSLGVEEQIAQDWLTVRKSKKLPLTKTALKAIERKAVAAGMPLNAVVKICCERGWGGFELDWLDEKTRNGQSAAVRSIYTKANA